MMAILSTEFGGRTARLSTGLATATSVSALAFGFLGLPAHAADTTTTTIQEVVVTAEKKTEKVQDVPIAIGVLTALDIEKQGIINIDDLAARTPNVQAILPFGPQEPQFSIRGVTETDFQPNQSSPIAVYTDGVFKSVGALQALQLFDVERIETLKGPQGTIEGRNATGGAINIITVAPSFEDTGNVMVGIGNDGLYQTSGALNVPIIPNQLAVRGAYTFENVDGYFTNKVPGAPYGGNLTGVFDYAFRLSTLWKPTEDLNFTLRLSSARSDPENYGEYSYLIGKGGEGIPPGALDDSPYYLTNTGKSIPQSWYTGVPGYPNGYTRQGLGWDDTQAVDVHRREIKSHGLSLEGNDQLTGWLKLTSITGWDQGQWNTPENDGGAPFNVDEARYFSRISSFQEEVRATSSLDGPYNFVFGLVYGHENLYLNEQTAWAAYHPAIYVAPDGSTTNICLDSGFYACTLYNSLNQTRTDYAAYLSNKYQITDDLQLTVGARYTDDSVAISNYKEGLSYIDNTQPGNPTVFEATYPGSQALQLSDHKWIGDVKLDYHITPDNMVYASWSTGFRGSAFNAAAQFVATNGVKPEELVDYEVGSKNTFFDHRLQANFGAFYYIYHNQQFATLGSNGLSAEINVGKINSKGIEADFTGKPLPNLTITANGGYLDAIYGDGLIANPRQQIYQANVPAFVDITGKRVYASPHFSFSTNVDYRILDADWGTVDWYVDGNGITKEYFNAANSPNSQENGYTLWNSRVSLELPDPDLTFSIWTANIFDRHYLTVIFDTNALVNYSFAERGTPRTFGVSATYRW